MVEVVVRPTSDLFYVLLFKPCCMGTPLSTLSGVRGLTDSALTRSTNYLGLTTGKIYVDKMRWRWNWHSRHHHYTDTCRSQIILELFVDIFWAMTEVRSKNARKHGRPLLDTWLFQNICLNGTTPVVGWIWRSLKNSSKRLVCPSEDFRQSIAKTRSTSFASFSVYCCNKWCCRGHRKLAKHVLFHLILQNAILRQHKEYGPHKYWTTVPLTWAIW